MHVPQDIDAAYELLRGSSSSSSPGGVATDMFMLDVTPRGEEQWKAANVAYRAKINGVDSELEERVRAMLTAAKDDPNEMFRVCAKFNALFDRDNIKTAIRDYQEQLIATVKKGINTLEAKFNQKYDLSMTRKMSTLRDIPPVSGAIIWARQIERQLEMYLKRVEDVLGLKWAQHVEGQRLKNETDIFRERLKPTRLVQSWLAEATKVRMGSHMLRTVAHPTAALTFASCCPCLPVCLCVLCSRQLSDSFDHESHILKFVPVKKQLEIQVNFDRQMVALFKEVNNLKKLGIPVSVALTVSANEAKEVYPFATRLQELLRMYQQSCVALDEQPALQTLAAKHKRAVQVLLKRTVQYRWASLVEKRAEPFVEQLAGAIVELHDKVSELVRQYDTIDKACKALTTCEPSPPVLGAHIQSIQTVIDQLDRQGFSNMRLWVERVDTQVEELLMARLKDLMEVWLITLDDPTGGASADLGYGMDVSTVSVAASTVSTLTMTPARSRDGEGKSAAAVSAADTKTSLLALIAQYAQADDDARFLRHEITLRNQVLQVYPPLQHSRLRLYQHLQRVVHMVCQLPRLKCFWSNQGGAGDPVAVAVPAVGVTGGVLTYGTSLLRKMASSLPASASSTPAPARVDLAATEAASASTLASGSAASVSASTSAVSSVIARCYAKIEAKMSSAQAYLRTWLAYQSLWDMDLGSIYKDLGDNISKWERLLQDMKRARAMFDTQEHERVFGPILIDYSAVQAKIIEKYYALHKEILSHFAVKLAEISQGLFNTHLRAARAQLETTTFSFDTTQDIVVSVTLLQTLNQKSGSWSAQLDELKAGEKLLVHQRFLFPDNWLYAERVYGEWTTLDQILRKRLATLSQETPAIQAKIGAEDQYTEARVRELNNEWKNTKPVQGDIPYSTALTTMTVFDTKLSQLEEALQRVAQVKRALELNTGMSRLSSSGVFEDERVVPLREELNALKEVWHSLGRFWRELEEWKDRRFADVIPKEIRKQLTAMQNGIQALPNHVRQYDACDHLRNVLKGYFNVNSLLVDLGSGVLQPKHKKAIMKELRLSGMWGEMTLGQLWGAELKRSEAALGAIIQTAQGENALQEFLNDLAVGWEQTRFELVEYKARCPLVRNWETLTTTLADKLNSLQSMSLSPFFKTFEREAGDWEVRLNKAHAIYDLFIDLQRKWVYLEGVFNNSADVQQQLAFQYNRFRTFDRDFIKLMQQIKSTPAVDVWIQEDKSLLSRLETYGETLNSIQKALGEYLQKQRSAFPRFYFVGDEDLLEILGNGKDPLRVMRHLGKMFAGIVSLFLDESGTVIHGIQSKEGERVTFVAPISVKDDPSVHAWLTKVEQQMQFTLATLLAEAVGQAGKLHASAAATDRQTAFFQWADRFPAQIALLSVQVLWSERVEAALSQGTRAAAALEELLQQIVWGLQILADRVLLPLPGDARKKYEQLITEYVRQRDVIRALIRDSIQSEKDFAWLGQMRFYFNPTTSDLMQKLQIRVSRASFFYGFEYLGVGERLVQTPLTDRAYLTLSEALHSRLGGNPFGPAGTGKTETVKALASQLGRFCLVFNCDESFDFQAMGRIFVGLCQCGAWGCFDEFNRLEERILSAVSQQILTIQVGLRENSREIQLLGNPVKLNPAMGVFITMNPGYAGRSNLPDNLKQLFRGIAMIHPDRRLIAQVMLFSQGFRTAEDLSGKVVLLFQLCADQLSSQFHYDFGLRALKSVLRSAGGLKRALVSASSDDATTADSAVLSMDAATAIVKEQELLLRSISSTVLPKLVADDMPLFTNLLSGVFPGVSDRALKKQLLREELAKSCTAHHYVDVPAWIDKIMQLQDILEINHGVIVVGPAGSGKSSAWQTLKESIDKVDSMTTEAYVLDPKSLDKEQLYGSLDPTTLEWTDGVFTHILRKILDNVRGEQKKRHWIVFDGDVDPEWAENLNSVLDDNKLLTLPNGERLALTDNIRILFEVQDLRFATLATVSRCGMVWFADHVVTDAMMYHHRLAQLRHEPIKSTQGQVYRNWQQTQQQCVAVLESYFASDGEMKQAPAADKDTSHAAFNDSFVSRAMELSSSMNHIMQFSRIRVLTALFSLLRGGIAKVLEYNEAHSDFPLSPQLVDTFTGKYLLFALAWCFGGSLSLRDRIAFTQQMRSFTSLPFPADAAAAPPVKVLSASSSPSLGAADELSLLDFEVRVDTGEWQRWSDRVPAVELDTHKVVAPDVVIETVDTVRHVDVLSAWLADHRPLILCGPPGSGKSMTLTSVLRALPDCDLVPCPPPPIHLRFHFLNHPHLMNSLFSWALMAH
jgi:dynein heavy chain 1